MLISSDQQPLKNDSTTSAVEQQATKITLDSVANKLTTTDQSAESVRNLTSGGDDASATAETTVVETTAVTSGDQTKAEQQPEVGDDQNQINSMLSNFNESDNFETSFFASQSNASQQQQQPESQQTEAGEQDGQFAQDYSQQFDWN